MLFCSCTSTRLIPSVATWLSAELGIYQTHASCDIIAACAGMPYGLSEAVRLLQEVNRPVLLVCAEKFSDKIGNVRTSRMLFGDAAAAIVIGPAPQGTAPDIDVMNTYASGPVKEVNATCQRFGFVLDSRARVDTLSVGSQQKVEIVKALHRGATHWQSAGR